MKEDRWFKITLKNELKENGEINKDVEEWIKTVEDVMHEQFPTPDDVIIYELNKIKSIK